MKVYIFTEGLKRTGYGHLTRCLSIYQAFEEKGITPTVIANCDDGGKKIIREVNLHQKNWVRNIDTLYNDIDVAIIDSYLAPIEIYEKIYQSSKTVVYIDDYIRLNYPPGIILNGTIGAEMLPYHKDTLHKYLLGIEYIPLRKEFWDVDIYEKRNEKKENVLITLGGYDYRNIAQKVLAYLLKKFPNFIYHVVLGNNIIEKIYNGKVNYFSLLNAFEMLNLMMKCDIAICAAGQTTYELARIGIPTVMVGIAKNQNNNIKGWIKKGFIKSEIWYNVPGYLDNISKGINDICSSNKKNIVYVDGQGARRIEREIMECHKD